MYIWTMTNLSEIFRSLLLHLIFLEHAGGQICHQTYVNESTWQPPEIVFFSDFS